MGTWGYFTEGKAPEGVKLTAYLNLVPRLRTAELYIYSPIGLHGVLLSIGKTLPLHTGRTQSEGAREERAGQNTSIWT
jgi:hypothetical protein